MTGNRLLDQLTGEQRGVLMAAAHLAERPHGSKLCEQGRTVDEVHFPLSGVYSVILSLQRGEQVESLTIGREGMVGASALLCSGASPFDVVTQVAGATASLPATTLRTLASRGGALDGLLRRYLAFELRALHQAAACNALHHVEQRLARRLLQWHDGAGADRLPLTQELLAAMLGIRRQSISEVASQLQRQGMIHYHRGLVEIVDRPALEAYSCECYAVVRSAYRALVGEPPSLTTPTATPPGTSAPPH